MGEETIPFSCIASRLDIVAQVVDKSNFPQDIESLVPTVLSRAPKEDRSVTFQASGWQFNITVSNGVTYMCATQDAPRRVCYSYLKDLAARFDGADLNSAAEVEAMEPVMRDRSKFHLDNDKLSSVQKDIDDVKQIMETNIEKVIARGERLSLLVDKTENLQQDSFSFKKNASKVESRYWWKDCCPCLCCC
eukprot:Rmarinus@m.22017